MEHARKRIMRCKHPTPCELCLTDCRRAEITVKENEIRSELLTACETSAACFRKLANVAMLSSSKPVLIDNAEIIEAAIAKATG